MPWVVKCRHSREFLKENYVGGPWRKTYGPYKKRGNAKRRARWCRAQGVETIPFDTLEGSIDSGHATIRFRMDEARVVLAYSRVQIGRIL